MPCLNVFLDRYGSYQLVGALEFESASVNRALAEPSFAYANSYLSSSGARPISLSLPFQDKPFAPSVTRAFFEGLLPEARARVPLAESLHASNEGYQHILARLNDETAGALVDCLLAAKGNDGADGTGVCRVGREDGGPCGALQG